MKNPKLFKSILLVLCMYCFVRMIMHSWNHGFDLTFDIRFLQTLVLLVGFILFQGIGVYLKNEEAKTDKEIESAFGPLYATQEQPISFKSLADAPDAYVMSGKHIYIENESATYLSYYGNWVKQ